MGVNSVSIDGALLYKNDAPGLQRCIRDTKASLASILIVGELFPFKTLGIQITTTMVVAALSALGTPIAYIISLLATDHDLVVKCDATYGNVTSFNVPMCQARDANVICNVVARAG